MATKKQKREAALAKRAEFEASVKASGLKAQQEDREHRELVAEEMRKIAREKMDQLIRATEQERERNQVRFVD